MWMAGVTRNVDDSSHSQCGWLESLAMWMARVTRIVDGWSHSQCGWLESLAMWMAGVTRNVDGLSLPVMKLYLLPIAARSPFSFCLTFS